MKKTVLTIAAALLLTATACASAPELRNMMPNSWEKLARLTAEEERELFNNDAVKTCTEKRKEYYAGKRNKETDIRAYSEKCGDLVFYRVLYCNERLDTFLQKEYRNCTITQKEYEYMWDIEMLQSMFIEEKNSSLRLIGGTSYHSFWTSQGEWDGFVFSDIMIRQLNESEIGFFVTEASVSFTIDRACGSCCRSIPISRSTGSAKTSCAYRRIPRWHSVRRASSGPAIPPAGGTIRCWLSTVKKPSSTKSCVASTRN